MKKTGLITALAVLLFASCNLNHVTPEGNKKTDTYVLSSFEAISISGNISLEIVNGEQSIQINTFENVFQYLRTEVDNKTLIIGTPNVNFKRNPEIKVLVGSDLVNTIRCSGSSDIYLNDYKISDLAIRCSGSSNTTGNFTGSLTIKSSGSSNVKLQLDSENLTLDASGSSKFNLTGIANNLNVDFSGSSKVEAFDLLTQNTTVKTSGSSKMNLFVEQTLSVNMSGSSKVNYKGNATITEIKLSGSSKIEKVD